MENLNTDILTDTAEPTSVLVVDDEPMVLELYSAWLEEQRYRVYQASSADEAQMMLKKSNISAVISDIRMTQATGIDLLAWIRSYDEKIPVILVTGAPAVDTAVEALRLNAYDYLLKPVEAEQLIRVTEHAADYHRLLREKEGLERQNRRYQQHLEQLVEQQTLALKRLNRQLLVLHQLVREINALEELSEYYQLVADAVQKSFDYLAVLIVFIDWKEEKVNLLALSCPSGHALPSDLSEMLDLKQLGDAACYEESLISNDIHRSPSWAKLDCENVQSAAFFPIITEGYISTAMLIVESRVQAFDGAVELVLQTLADHLKVSIANAELYAQAQKALRIREQVLQNVSHELRTPLTIIHGYAEMMADGAIPLGSEHSEVGLQTIMEQSFQLQSLVDRLITLQELEDKELQLTAIAVEPWLEMIATTRMPIFAKAKQHLRTEILPEIGQIQGHRAYLDLALNNILENASKFSPSKGEVIIKAWRKPTAVIIAVIDDGIGVAPEQMPNLFERFYQAEGGRRRRYQGMGLGLSLTNEIIQKHGGRMWMKSAGENAGATVYIELPDAEAR